MTIVFVNAGCQAKSMLLGSLLLCVFLVVLSSNHMVSMGNLRALSSFFVIAGLHVLGSLMIALGCKLLVSRSRFVVLDSF